MGSTGPKEVDVLVVGAGFGGCYLLHLLRNNGFRTKVLEAGVTLGGVWCWNRYPGARVDVEFPYYGFSDPAISETWTYTERYPGDAELRRYFEHVDKVWDLSKDIELNTRVTQATYDSGHWNIETAQGEVYTAKWFIAATGTSFKQNFPSWEGIENYKGVIHHSSLWPNEPVEFKGKRVAVIGAGSTGVQVVQETAKSAASVVQIIRTPNLALPMRQRQISEDEIYSNKAYLKHVFNVCRGHTKSGLPIENTGRRTFDDDERRRREVWEEQWKRGGFNWSQGCYTDWLIDKKANKATYDFWLEKTRPRITDPRKRDLLAPLEPPYYIGTKRPSLEQNYYEMCDQDHVDITDSPIVRFTETGIQTEEKSYDLDIVAVCTGYDAVTGGLRTMGIKGRNGLDLDKKWKDGVATHVGTIVHGFPNFFMVYGPQAPTSLTNGPPFIELQCEWILDTMTAQREQGIATVEAKKEAEDAWRKSCLDMANATLAVETNSWYMGANVPGKKREFLIYMGGLPAWHQACREALKDWSGFEIHQTV